MSLRDRTGRLPILVQCAWCGRILPTPAAAAAARHDRLVSHGACDDCLRDLSRADAS